MPRQVFVSSADIEELLLFFPTRILEALAGHILYNHKHGVMYLDTAHPPNGL